MTSAKLSYFSTDLLIHSQRYFFNSESEAETVTDTIFEVLGNLIRRRIKLILAAYKRNALIYT